MNAKKKNKKANKPPNPNPPQNLETESKAKENVEEIQIKCEVKEESVVTPAPVIGSEIVEVQVSDDKKIECESPRKPKRNKGKKKKQDKDEEIIENVQKTQDVQQEPNIGLPLQEPIPEVVIEDKTAEEKADISDNTNIVPSARKKKNKKKAHEKTSEESKISANFPVQVPEEQPKLVKKVDSDTLNLFSAVEEQETKKKKNKKIHRTDSERSDKSETGMSCTSAFQKLLSENEHELADIKTESQQKLKALTSELGSKLTEKSDKKDDEPKPVEKVEKLTIKGQDYNDPGNKDDSKNKKKSKKDKKQLPKEISEELKTDVPQDTSFVIDDNIMKKMVSDEVKPDIKESIEIPLHPKEEKEPSPKTTAKIAKPVEKKRKGKQDEQVPGKTKEEYKEESEFPKEPNIKVEEMPIFNIIEPQVKSTQQQKDSKPIDSSAVFPVSVENINIIPSTDCMGKKRIKSPKPSKDKESHHVNEDAVKVSEKPLTEMGPEIIEFAIISDTTKPDSILISKPEELASNTLEVLPEEFTMLQETQKMDIIDTKLLQRPLTPDTIKDDGGFQTKTSKKKKKIPKTPKIDVTPELQEPITHTVQKTEDNQNKPKVLVVENIDIPLDVSSLADTEVRSLRTDESAALSCDAIPDVLFIRSSSQQLFDNNNNTVIQELISLEGIKIIDPLVIPLIEGSGETPILTPEPITSDISMTNLEAKTLPEEKTDIKSKIMEVNQDMEDLRLSIERSLAEFTALEKSEYESEQKLETQMLLTKEKSPLKDVEKKDKDKEEQAIIPTKIIKHIPVQDEGKKEGGKSSSVAPVKLFEPLETPPAYPARKDNKGKSKSKKKGQQETTSATTASCETTSDHSKVNTKEEKPEKSEQKSEQKSESSQEKGKQQSATSDDNSDTAKEINNENTMDSITMDDITEQDDFDTIENFEDALTSSVDDVNKTFEMIVKDADDDNIKFQKKLAANKPEINIVEPVEDRDTNRNDKVNPVSQPKNLLGQTNISVQSNKTDYKKEKNKTPNARQARVKIKDSTDIEAKKQSKESQTDIKKARMNSDISVKESFSRVNNDSEEYVYKYSFRKVFLQSACHVCNKDLTKVRVPCGFCNLVFYCGAKHKDENWPQHQALCFAVSTLAHAKDQKHIYADAKNVTGQDYRLLRMQMIVSCEKVLKRRLVPWEQEAMLYPRMCADVSCREWRQNKLKDCDGCGQLSYCANHPEHLPKSHSRWCKSYSLYQKLVSYQQTKGRLEPRLPTKVMKQCDMPGKMNEVLASMYEEKIDMNDIQYAALTQLATAPLTAAHCLQLCRNVTNVNNVNNNIYKKKSFTIHVVGAELQFEADVLNKWEVFFLHLRPYIEELKVVLVSPMLNPGNLPLDLLARIKLCDSCHQNKRRVVFKFEDNKNYFDYRTSEDYINPDIICAFNSGIQRSSIYNGKDPWPATINSILKLKQPFIITSYTLNELRKDIARVKQVAEMDFKLVLEPGFNSFASVRPDRNFISDDEMPLLFKNYCVAVVLGF